MLCPADEHLPVRPVVAGVLLAPTPQPGEEGASRVSEDDLGP